MLTKKGQGLSLSVIIVAALALIVLVVLAVIFTTKSAQFQQQVSEETKTELIKLKIGYSECHPDAAKETTFQSEFDAAESPEGKEAARSKLKQETSRCKAINEKSACEAGGCAWQ